MLWLPERSSSHARWIPPKGSRAMSGIHWCAVVVSSFTRIPGDHVVPPSEERSNITSFVAYDHHVARTVPFGATFTIPPKVPGPETMTFRIQVAPPLFDRVNARSWRVEESVFHTQYRFPALSFAALSLSAKFGLSS